MIKMMGKSAGAMMMVGAMMMAQPLFANSLIAQAVPVAVAKSTLEITPQRDWNKLSIRPGKKAETWTLDGPSLNDLAFYAGIAAGEPLLREQSKKRAPLPKWPANALLTDVPEFLEGSYRTKAGIAVFNMGKVEPTKFLDGDGVRFSFDYMLGDEVGRQGVAVAALRGGKLYMISYEAPRLHFFDRNVADFEAVISAARLNPAP